MVRVKTKPNGTPAARTASSRDFMVLKARPDCRIAACDSGLPSSEMASTSTSPAIRSSLLAESSVPLLVTVVLRPLHRARSSSSGSDGYISGSPPDTLSTSYPRPALSSMSWSRWLSSIVSSTSGPEFE